MSEGDRSKVLLGAPVAEAMRSDMVARVAALGDRGVKPRLAIVRVGQAASDLAYERGARKRLEGLGMEVETCALDPGIDDAGLDGWLRDLAADPAVHAILLMRPLPSGLDEAAAIACIPPSKDVDGCTTANVASVYAGDGKGFAPCTPEGVMRLLDHYGVRLDGARVCVLGRSLVVGRPLASLLVSRDATVTICHSHTADLALECRSADVVVSAMGRARSVTSKMIAPGSVVIDVGMNVDDEGRLCGDVDYEAVSEVASAVTPVPRGTGSVTTSVLAEHVVRAAEAAAVEGV